jgi:hypothetical protein
MNPFQWVASASLSIWSKVRKRKPYEVRLIKDQPTGAENWSTRIPELIRDLTETRDQEVVPAKLNGGHAALLESTAEFSVIQDIRERIIEDELGEWDPEDADWTTPALIFEATVRETWQGWTSTVPVEDRPAIVLTLADKILCGVSTGMV